MSNYPGNIKQNIETPEGYPQIIPSAPPLDTTEPIEVYAQPIQQNPPIVYVTKPIIAPPNYIQPPRLTIEQFQPNYVHNSRLYAPRRNNNDQFYYIPRNNNPPRQNNNKGFFASLAACLCCLFCCCPIGC